jgi:hypothetical protein
MSISFIARSWHLTSVPALARTTGSSKTLNPSAASNLLDPAWCAIRTQDTKFDPAWCAKFDPAWCAIRTQDTKFDPAWCAIRTQDTKFDPAWCAKFDPAWCAIRTQDTKLASTDTACAPRLQGD